MERGLEMKMQLLNREESLKRLNVQVEQLDFQLRQTQQGLTYFQKYLDLHCEC